MAETRIGLIANPEKEGAGELLHKLIDAFASVGIATNIEKTSAELIGKDDGIEIKKIADVSDMLVVLGGDGSLLWVFSQLREKVKPLAGINIGTLGFLSCATGEEYRQLVDVIAENKYSISDRAIVRASLTIEENGKNVEAGVYYGLNEVSISRASSSRMIHVEAQVNGQYVNHFSGDGVIISTPTGSTAYSLSAGGPIIDPASGVFSMTPICPHALANRAIVTSDSSTIDLLMQDPSDPLLLSVDGNPVVEIKTSAKIRMDRAEFNLPLLAMPNASFYELLHHKLGWIGSSVIKRK